MVPTASLILFAFAASGLQCNAILPASLVGRHVGRHANLNVTIARAGPFAKQQAGLVYKGFYEVASGEREPSNRREEGFMKLVNKTKNAGGGLVEDAPNATKPVYFDQCHVNKWLSGKAPPWCDEALEVLESKRQSRHLLDGKTMAIIRGSKRDDQLGHTRRTFSPIEDKANTSPCTDLYDTSEQTVAVSGEAVMGELTAFTIPTIDRLEQGLAFPSPLPTWLLKDKITRGTSHSVWEGFPVGFPVNPRHCTGVISRGGLGKWGPNFAADSLLGRKNPTTEELEILLIKRKDSGDWAFPGGMVDDKEYHTPVITAARELIEETLTGKEGESICDNWSTIQEKPSFQAMMKTLGLEVAEGDIKFACKNGEDKCKEADCEVHISGNEEHGGVETLQSSATPVYAGYVDDPRNTDNAWMESFVLGWMVPDNLPDNLAKELTDLPGGSDSSEVAWWPIHKSIPKGSGGEAPMLQDGTLFASHSFFLRAATHFILKEKLGFANEVEIRKALAKAEKQSPYNLYLKAFNEKVYF
ncbi:unnamed protein product [Vitrella brassicaformis CCMP3155]|uniref:Nudix hydrolase domain-containing protein n=1 Tax=Vitrella brassicaformis (strain CCMP3155) TaxID=1169540 RepID=A0A0G4ECZ5_VITBC|nr:unnamed protein product [Vitrella brassicaformis CCMP3155]|eukprot:CEL93546.1 unnamed protein product [Vitrella brassicaformis CCMP3155]